MNCFTLGLKLGRSTIPSDHVMYEMHDFGTNVRITDWEDNIISEIRVTEEGASYHLLAHSASSSDFDIQEDSNLVVGILQAHYDFVVSIRRFKDSLEDFSSRMINDVRVD